MKNLFILAVSLFLFASCNERIDAGHEGLLVKMYGTEKGVQDVSLVTGRVWYNPFTEDVHEVPTFVQTFDYPSFTVNAKDGSVFTVDPTISIKIQSGKSATIFTKYRKPLNEVIENTISNHIKDVYRIEFNKFTTDEIISNREKFENGVQEKMNDFFNKETKMRKLINEIVDWGFEKEILSKSSPLKQQGLTEEEVQELRDAIIANDIAEIKDAIGDIVVTLILQSELNGLDFVDCVQSAYDVISKLTGKMVDGVFVKDN